MGDKNKSLKRAGKTIKKKTIEFCKDKAVHSFFTNYST